MGQPSDRSENRTTNIPVQMAQVDPPATEETETEPDDGLTPEEREQQQRLAAIYADIDKGAEQYALAYTHQLHPEDALKLSIKRHYDMGRGSIQDYARIYRVEVQKVLEILDAEDVGTIEFIGDLIDQKEAGPEAHMSDGKAYPINFDLK